MTSRATKDVVDGKPVLRFERRLNHPPEKVWRAVTEPDELAHWFPAKVDYELKPGAPITFVDEDMGPEPTTGEVLEADPPRVFVFSWTDNVFRIEIVPDGAGSVLHFSHTLGTSDQWGDERFAAQHAAGWDVCLDHLVASMDGVEPGKDDWAERNEYYVEQWGLARGTVTDGRLRFERVLIQPRDEVLKAIPSDTGAAEYEVSELPFGSSLVVTEDLEDDADVAAVLAKRQVELELLVAKLNGLGEREWPQHRVAELTESYRTAS